MAYFPIPKAPVRAPLPTFQPPTAAPAKPWYMGGGDMSDPARMGLLSAGAALLSGGDMGQGILAGMNAYTSGKNAQREQEWREEERAYRRHRDAVEDTRYDNETAMGDYRDSRDFGYRVNEDEEDDTYRAGRDTVEDERWRAGHALDQSRFGFERDKYADGAAQRAAELDETRARADYYRTGGAGRSGSVLDVSQKDIDDFRASLAMGLGVPEGESLAQVLGPERMLAGEQEFARVYQATKDAAQATAAARIAMGLPADAGYEDTFWPGDAGIYGTPVGGERGILGDFTPPQVPQAPTPPGTAQAATPAGPAGATQSATNPQTGEKVYLVNGQWVDAKGNPVQ